jgi:hypothetical protein
VRELQQHLGQRAGVGMTDLSHRMLRPSLRAVRNASAVVTVLAVAALGILASQNAHAVTTHTVTRHTTVVTRVDAPTAAQSPASPVGLSEPVPSVPLVTSAPVVTTTAIPAVETASLTPAPTSQAPPVAPAAPETATSTATGTGTPAGPGTGPTSTTQPQAIPVCPLPVAAPSEPGGLASIVGLAPLFGPLSSEAFAAAPVFQPPLQDIGPFLVAFANEYAAAEPSLAPLAAQVESLENSGYSVASPLYGPYRSEFLAAESALATALAPTVKTLATNAATSCVIDIEGALTTAAPST